MTEIANYIETYLGIKPQDFTKIADFFEERHVDKDIYLSHSGRYQANLSFIKKGYVRIFNIDPKTGKEITQWISTPGNIVTDLSSLFFGSPAKWDIQTITECELFTMSIENYKLIGNRIPNWNHLEKLFMAKCFNTLEDRVYSHLSMSSEERYKLFFAMNPDLFNQVPLQYIASMLGMTPETFSRVRKKLSS